MMDVNKYTLKGDFSSVKIIMLFAFSIKFATKRRKCFRGDRFGKWVHLSLLNYLNSQINYYLFRI